MKLYSKKFVEQKYKSPVDTLAVISGVVCLVYKLDSHSTTYGVSKPFIPGVALCARWKNSKF